MVLRHAAPHHPRRLGIEHVRQAAFLGHLHVALHVAVGDTRTARQLPRERHRFRLQRRVRDPPRREAEGNDAVGIQDLRREVELPRQGGAEEAGEKVAAAEIAGETDLCEGRGHPRRVADHPQVAGERDAHAGAGRDTVHHGDRGLRHLVQQARALHEGAKLVGALLGRCIALPRRLRLELHVAPGAEPPAGAGHHDAADCGIRGEAGQRLGHRRHQRRRQRVQPLRPVQRDDRDAILGAHEQLLVHLRPLSCSRQDGSGSPDRQGCRGNQGRLPCRMAS